MSNLAPYRDFAYFHVPNQTYLWALFYHFTNYYLFTARVFCVICGWLLLVVIFVVAMRLWQGYPNRVRLSLAAGSVLLLVASPSFSYTSGRAWNHDLPVLLTVVAFLAHVHGLRRPAGSFWFWFSGLLVGFAAATRLSFAPAVLPFALSHLAHSSAGKRAAHAPALDRVVWLRRAPWRCTGALCLCPSAPCLYLWQFGVRATQHAIPGSQRL